MKRLKIFMAREMFSNNVTNKELIAESKKIADNQDSDSNKYANPLKKALEKGKMKSKGVENKAKSQKNVFVYIKDKFINNNGRTRNYEYVVNTERTSESPKINEKIEENINELPYSKAIFVDKRNVFLIFYSFIIEKLELISIFCYEYQIKSILLSEYILALLIDFFFNALLYSDDVVSNKYHNNGKLDIIVTLTLSILSNIISSILCFYIKYSRGIEERIKPILEIRHSMHYYKNMKRLLLYLKIKFICFFISELFITAICLYYIVIFCILYTCSQSSLIVNYCYSLIESIVTSFGISLIILITRKIGLSCPNKELYNTSKYINSKF